LQIDWTRNVGINYAMKKGPIAWIFTGKYGGADLQQMTRQQFKDWRDRINQHRGESFSKLDSLHERVCKENKYKVGDKFVDKKDKGARGIIQKVISDGQYEMRLFTDGRVVGDKVIDDRDLSLAYNKESFSKLDSLLERVCKEGWKQLGKNEWEIRNNSGKILDGVSITKTVNGDWTFNSFYRKIPSKYQYQKGKLKSEDDAIKLAKQYMNEFPQGKTESLSKIDSLHERVCKENKFKVGDRVKVTLNNGDVIIGKLEKENPIKIRTDATSTRVIPDGLIKLIQKEYLSKIDTLHERVCKEKVVSYKGYDIELEKHARGATAWIRPKGNKMKSFDDVDAEDEDTALKYAKAMIDTGRVEESLSKLDTLHERVCKEAMKPEIKNLIVKLRQDLKKYGSVSPINQGDSYISLSGNIPNEFRKQIIDKIFPGGNVLDMNDINYGNVRSNGVSLHPDQWIKVMGYNKSDFQKESLSNQQMDALGIPFNESIPDSEVKLIADGLSKVLKVLGFNQMAKEVKDKSQEELKRYLGVIHKDIMGSKISDEQKNKAWKLIDALGKRLMQ